MLCVILLDVCFFSVSSKTLVKECRIEEQNGNSKVGVERTLRSPSSKKLFPVRWVVIPGCPTLTLRARVGHPGITSEYSWLSHI